MVQIRSYAFNRSIRNYSGALKSPLIPVNDISGRDEPKRDQGSSYMFVSLRSPN
jgi:hypothetical protein